MNCTATVFVTAFIVANKMWVFIYVAPAKVQSVRRLATEWEDPGFQPQLWQDKRYPSTFSNILVL